MALKTTVGQLLVNAALPEKFRDYERTLTKDEADAILADMARDDPTKYREISWKLMQLGREAAFTEGTTLKLSDLQQPIDKSEMIKHVDMQEKKIQQSNMTAEEKEQALEVVYGEVQQLLTDQTYEAALKAQNPFALQVKSKARGAPSQLASMLTTPGTYQDGQNRTIPVFIRKSFSEGLDPHEYWAATYGARKGVISCLVPETEVVMSDWSVRQLGVIKVDDWIMGVNASGTVKPVRVSRIFDNGYQDVYEYTFRKNATGQYLYVRGTEQHKLMARIWHAGERGAPRVLRNAALHPLKEASFCARTSRNNYVAQLTGGLEATADGGVREPRALLLGLMLGDGCTTHSTRGSMSFSCADNLLAAQTNKYLTSFGLELNKAKGDNYNWTIRSRSDAITCWTVTPDGKKFNNPTRAWLWSIMGGMRSEDKRIPDEIWEWDQQSVAELIAGYLAADGCIVSAVGCRGWVSFGSVSRALLGTLARLLEYRFGIWCNPVYTDHEDRLPMHQLTITHPESLSRLRRILRVPGVKASRMVLDVNKSEARHAALGCRAQTRSYIGQRRVMDIEVDDPNHCYMLANGLISSNSKFATRDAGALGKQFGTAVATMVVTGPDCETPYGIPVKSDDKDNIGSVLARKTGQFPAGTVINKAVMAQLHSDDNEEIIVRSPLTCALPEGLCKQCVGLREDGKFPEIGAHIGYNASSALAERIAQSSLNVKHTGKAMAGEEEVYAGFPVVEQLATIPSTFPNRAAVSEVDGKIEKIEPAEQGGTHITISGQEHYVGPDLPVKVEVGDIVEPGDQLSGGILNPADAVRLKGIGEGRRYFVERMTQAFRESKYGINRRNVEVLGRAMVDHVKVNDGDGLGNFLPGDVTSYNALAYTYKPRATAARMGLKKAVGSYLEEPAMHFTIGTRMTKQMAEKLAKFGVEDVLVDREPTGFTPNMVGLAKVPEHGTDWVARLGSTYLQSRLLQDVHRGAESNIHGLHPVPGIAKGVEFGKQKGSTFTF